MELWHHIIIVVSCTNASELIWIITNRSYSTCLENGEFLTLLQNTHQCKQWSFMSMISFLFHLFSRRAYCSGAVYQTWKKSDAIDEIQRPTVAIPDLSYVTTSEMIKRYDRWSSIISFILLFDVFDIPCFVLLVRQMYMQLQIVFHYHEK